MKRITFGFVLVLVSIGSAVGSGTPISEDTETCLECHATLHPGIVEGWKKSRHAQVTPGEAMTVSGIARKVSSKTVPEELKIVALGHTRTHLTTMVMIFMWW
jgi:hydroxylamine dehydrogenase